jgi:hypothetical protein
VRKDRILVAGQEGRHDPDIAGVRTGYRFKGERRMGYR